MALASEPAGADCGSLCLFNGQDLFGWTTSDKENWKVQSSSAVQVDEKIGKSIFGTASDKPTILRTTTQFGNYSLQVNFKLSDGAKAVLLLRSDPKGNRCAQIPLKYNPVKSGDFCTVAIPASFLDSCKLGRGYVGIKLESGTIEIQSISIAPTGLKSLFNGIDANNWVKHDIIDVSIESPHLVIKNGNGSLESKEKFADMELSMSVFVNGEGLNSGVFFRCIPGEKMNGYECQIQNQFLDGDRSKPKDCGTGGIFRRVNAREVRGNDKCWTNLYINAVGNHIAVWVEGVQVTDWTDTRAANLNPRKGLRTEAGTVQLQAHDATTNIMFKDIKAGEMQPR